MCYICNNPGANREDYLAIVRESIRECGMFIQHVEGNARRHSTDFSYTIGLHGIGHPELLVLGCDPNTATNLLSWVAHEVGHGRMLVPGDVLDIEPWQHRVTIESVPNPGEITYEVNNFYRRPRELPVDVFQLTYDDEAGRFPWEPGYSLPAWLQPRPGEFRAG